MSQFQAFTATALPRALAIFTNKAAVTDAGMLIAPKKTLNDWMLVLATALGSLGGFPSPPKFFQHFGIYKIFQLVNTIVLLYQGGAGTDLVFSTIAGIAFVALIEILHLFGL